MRGYESYRIITIYTIYVTTLSTHVSKRTILAELLYSCNYRYP